MKKSHIELLRRRLMAVAVVVLLSANAPAADPPRVPTHRVLVVSAAVDETKLNGKPWDLASPCDLRVRISRRDKELERQWVKAQAKVLQREGFVGAQGVVNKDPQLVQLTQDRDEVAAKFVGETPTASAFEHEWNHEAIEVATGDVLLLQVLDMDSAAHDVIGCTQWRATAEALGGGTVSLSFERVIELKLEFRPLGAAPPVPDAPLSRELSTLTKRLRGHVTKRIKGTEDEFFVVALVESTYRDRGLGFLGTVHEVTFLLKAFVDFTLSPVAILSRGELTITPDLPPLPPNTVRVDDVRFVVVKGRDAARKRVIQFASQFVGLPAFPDQVMRLRSYAVMGRHAAAADAERQVEQLHDHVEAVRRRH